MFQSYIYLYYCTTGKKEIYGASRRAGGLECKIVEIGILVLQSLSKPQLWSGKCDTLF